MTDPSKEKSILEESRDIISQLKEMEHYSTNNIEKLSEFWLVLDDKLDQKEFAGRMEKILSHQNAFHDEISSLIADYEIECNRIAQETE
ncbi:MAG: hypothetical protein U5R06_10985 [candidate division KSB1 bacterium]|nr:hypothetical protein [candidate division KSB1 bacterium]